MCCYYYKLLQFVLFCFCATSNDGYSLECLEDHTVPHTRPQTPTPKHVFLALSYLPTPHFQSYSTSSLHVVKTSCIPAPHTVPKAPPDTSRTQLGMSLITTPPNNNYIQSIYTRILVEYRCLLLKEEMLVI